MSGKTAGCSAGPTDLKPLTRWPRSLLAHGVEAIPPINNHHLEEPPHSDFFGSKRLAVDEHVVGLVRDAHDRRRLRVARAGRGDAADRVEAKHLHDLRQQSGGIADLGGVEAQFGDVVRAVRVPGDDLPLTALPSGACHCGGPATGCTKVWWMPPNSRASTSFWVKANDPSVCGVQA